MENKNSPWLSSPSSTSSWELPHLPRYASFFAERFHLLILSLLPLLLLLVCTTTASPSYSAAAATPTPPPANSVASVALLGDRRAELLALLSDERLLRHLQMMAMLRAKVRWALRRVPLVERVVFGECERESGVAGGDAARLARCILDLLAKVRKVQGKQGEEDRPASAKTPPNDGREEAEIAGRSGSSNRGGNSEYGGDFLTLIGRGLLTSPLGIFISGEQQSAFYKSNTTATYTATTNTSIDRKHRLFGHAGKEPAGVVDKKRKSTIARTSAPPPSTTTTPMSVYERRAAIFFKEKIGQPKRIAYQSWPVQGDEKAGKPESSVRMKKWWRYRRAKRKATNSSETLWRERRSTLDFEKLDVQRLSAPRKNIEKLQRIRKFCREIDKMDGQFKRINQHKTRIATFFKDVNDLSDGAASMWGSSTKRRQREATEGINSNQEGDDDNGVVRVLSPKLFSLFPDALDKVGDTAGNGQTIPIRNKAGDVLSPSLLGFHELNPEDEEDADNDSKSGNDIQHSRGDGKASRLRFTRDISIPRLLRLVHHSPRQRLKWLDFLIEVSGVGAVLNSVEERLSSLSRLLNADVLPAMGAVERVGRAWTRVVDSTAVSAEQVGQLRDQGYTLLSPVQRKILGRATGGGGGDEAKRHRKKREVPLTPAEADTAFEEELERIARLLTRRKDAGVAAMRRMWDEVLEGQKKRFKRESSRRRVKREISGPVLGVFSPFAFVPSLNSLQLFTLYLFSPQFGIVSYFNPAAFYAQIFTPWAALANLFSPQWFTILFPSPVLLEANAFSQQTIILEALSPTIVQANLLNPNAIVGTIASPQLFIGDLLTPNILQVKFLSPQHFFATLLSPNLGSPNLFYSNQSYFIDILSPQFVSPNIKSYVKNAILILSPDILSGGGDAPTDPKVREHFTYRYESEEGRASFPGGHGNHLLLNPNDSPPSPPVSAAGRMGNHNDDHLHHSDSHLIDHNAFNNKFD